MAALIHAARMIDAHGIPNSGGGYCFLQGRVDIH